MLRRRRSPPPPPPPYAQSPTERAPHPVNRLSGTKSWFRIKPRRTYLAPHDLPKWMKAVQGLSGPPEREPGTGKQLPKLKTGETARDFLMVLLLTGLRRSEALELEWSNVDLEARTLTILDPKNRQPHTLPLSDYLQPIFKRRQESTPGAFVFADNQGIRFSNIRFAIDRDPVALL
jgi:integrase